MKQKLILWLAAIVITFLTGYIKSVTDEYLPVSGTIGIEGKKVSYLFDKFYRGKFDYKIIIRSDKEDLTGKLFWKKKDEKEWKKVNLNETKETLYAEIPRQPAGTIILYKVVINYNNKEYLLPSEDPVTLKFSGYVPSFLMILFNIALFGGLLMSTRTGLEYFREKNNIKKYSLITVFFLFIYSIVITPLKNTYSLEALNNRVPGISELFDLQAIVLFALWISGMILVFNLKNNRLPALIISILTIIVFLI